ncbi:MAG: prolyl oligopeptidase family serine peptidase [Chitinophagaceae bacterium]|nr:prolyl oligopeptidase family serine peptidase [Chitinophagaceae bacterium]MCW5927138.1 prolyl oligopeptidase family serine peptidase [Chitinophagaceae bacterium]
MKNILLFFAFTLTGYIGLSQTRLEPLTVEKIMRDPKWIGSSPSDPEWSADGKTLYFQWNPDNAPADSLYAFDVQSGKINPVAVSQKSLVVFARNLVYNSARTQYVYARDGDIFWQEIKSGKAKQITQTTAPEFAPAFSFNDTKVVYQQGDNLFAWDITTGETRQLINIQKEKKADTEKKKNIQEDWLKNDQLQLLEMLRERKEKKEATKAYNKTTASTALKPVYTGNKNIRNARISAGGNFISLILFNSNTEGKRTIIPNYVTESGFTEDINGRTKVGAPFSSGELMIYNRQLDTAYIINTDSLPGINDLPDYVKDYPGRKTKETKRPVNITTVQWAPGADAAVVSIRSVDNKDKWIMLLDPGTGILSLLDRQRDEAWIGGPINNAGWINNELYWFQSEVSGYSHLYTVNTRTKEKKALTGGSYEVQNAALSSDKKYFYITTNQVHPGEKQFYRLHITDLRQERITAPEGANEVTVSPDETKLATLYSYSNKPAELFLQDTKPGSKARQLTYKAQSDEFKTYPWRAPEVITFKARDGGEVYARLYKPANPHPSKPAVIFVHGAGYLQNAHKWWSSYFREYMFHNLLADNGYYVLDMDYRASAGYGRDWRTGIYRFMGGKDLTDHIDGAHYLSNTFGVDPKRIGIYGGSYGGFITLMGLFTAPGTFAAGAALRPVTDWAHYNHGYTSNILNTPAEDSIAYRKSSPVYHAEGLKDELLICHGVVDVNVHFQDVVRLTQRLIELGKDNWEVAMYPVEDHGFVEPSSWTDEYKRIFKLFERVLKK